jgi:hypothetical protein
MGKAGLQLKNSTTGEWDDIVAEPNGSLPVTLQDQTTPPVFIKAIIVEDTFVLESDMVVGEFTFDALDSYGINVGHIIEIYNGVQWIQADVLIETVDTPVVGTNRYTIDQPIDYPYAVASTTCYFGTDNLNVNGSVTPQVARITNKHLNVSWDITEIAIYIQDGTSMDGSGFGALGALTKGILWRARTTSPVSGTSNGFNAKSNHDLTMISDFFAYDDRAPAGSFSLSVKKHLI